MPESAQKYSNKVPIWRLVFLSVITFNLYQVYWFYKNWRFFKEKEKLEISPFWRAIFSVIFIYSILKRIFGLTKKKDLNKWHSPVVLTILWILLEFMGLLDNIPQFLGDQMSVLSYVLLLLATILPLLSVLVLIPAQRLLNNYWRKVESNLPIKPFTWWQIVLIIFFAFGFLFFWFGDLFL